MTKKGYPKNLLLGQPLRFKGYAQGAMPFGSSIVIDTKSK